jgi:hypothetical protein
MFERGSELREGAESAPSIMSPLSSQKTSGLPAKIGWRGARGEAYI